jgi:hypothetical protein
MNVLAAEHRAKRRHAEAALLLALVLAVTGACGTLYAIKLIGLVNASTVSLSVAAGARH